MKTATLCLVVADGKILLGMKKRGFGEGRWNGFGGRVEDGETLVAAALRELDEEAGLQSDTASLNEIADITFHFSGEPGWRMHAFRVSSWRGEPHETEEMRPQWHPLDAIPYDQMWEADRRWLPLVLAGKRIQADAFYRSPTDHVLEDFRWRESNLSGAGVPAQ